MTSSGLLAENLACVLVHPEHAGNVGSAARALGNLGLADLRLVERQSDHLELDANARAMACAFQPLLAAATRHAHLPSALADCVLAVALVSPMRHRDVASEDLRVLAPRIAAASQRGKVALVFGPEQSGLVHADVGRCDLAAHLHLPSDRPTLNLAQAVLLATYELRRETAATGGAASCLAEAPRREPAATHAEVDAVLAALDALLTRLGYGDADAPLHARIGGRCRALAQRAELTRGDVQMLHGLLARLDPRTC